MQGGEELLECVRSILGAGSCAVSIDDLRDSFVFALVDHSDDVGLRDAVDTWAGHGVWRSRGWSGPSEEGVSRGSVDGWCCVVVEVDGDGCIEGFEVGGRD